MSGRERSNDEVYDLLLRIERDFGSDLNEIKADLKTKVPRELHDEQLKGVKQEIEGVKLEQDRMKARIGKALTTAFSALVGPFVVGVGLYLMLRNGSPL